MKSSEFTHNNMMPFFGGSLKQNVNVNANSSLLESHTGNIKYKIEKKEKRPFFQPKKKYEFCSWNPFSTKNQ
jgi:hypothetical protein